MLMDDPYESEEDEVGRATATKEAMEIMEFESRASFLDVRPRQGEGMADDMEVADDMGERKE